MAPAIEQVIITHIKHMEDRLAGMLAKIGIDNNMSLIILMENIKRTYRYSDEEMKDYNESIRKKAVKNFRPNKLKEEWEKFILYEEVKKSEKG